MLPDDLDFLNAPLSVLKFTPSWPGVLRIVGWTVFFLVTINYAVSSAPTTVEEDTLIPMMTLDSNWSRPDPAVFPSVSQTSIAWIAGSSVNIKVPSGKATKVGESSYPLPKRVIPILDEMHDFQQPVVYFYQLNARRILDTYTLVLDALARKPDALVITLNPFWVYNGHAVFYEPKLFNRGAALWWNERDWPMQVTLTSPGSHLWNISGRHLPLIANSGYYRKQVDEWFDSPQQENKIAADAAHPAKSKSPRKRNQKKGAAKKVFYNLPLKFWLHHRDFNGDSTNLFDKGGKIYVRNWQAAAMRKADSRAWPADIVRNLLEVVKASKVPTLIYLAPVSPTLKEPAYQEVLGALESIAAEYKSDSLRILIKMPATVTETLEFRDYLHLKHAGGLPDLLALEISMAVKHK